MLYNSKFSPLSKSHKSLKRNKRDICSFTFGGDAYGYVVKIEVASKIDDRRKKQ